MTLSNVDETSGFSWLPSHSSGRADPPLLGSTTEKIVKRSPVPVLVFPVRFLEKRFGMVTVD